MGITHINHPTIPSPAEAFTKAHTHEAGSSLGKSFGQLISHHQWGGMKTANLRVAVRGRQISYLCDFLATVDEDIVLVNGVAVLVAVQIGDAIRA